MKIIFKILIFFNSFLLSGFGETSLSWLLLSTSKHRLKCFKAHKWKGLANIHLETFRKHMVWRYLQEFQSLEWNGFWKHPENIQKCCYFTLCLNWRRRYLFPWGERIMVTDARRRPIEAAPPADRVGHRAQSSQGGYLESRNGRLSAQCPSLAKSSANLADGSWAFGKGVQDPNRVIGNLPGSFSGSAPFAR